MAPVVMHVKITVGVDPAGRHIGCLPRLRLILSILMGRPVLLNIGEPTPKKSGPTW